jgi:hypothetical protein
MVTCAELEPIIQTKKDKNHKATWLASRFHHDIFKAQIKYFKQCPL